ncbi:YciI family protein [Kocuria tytonis]|uniref:YCII-related domain-containing protein n=1 Tax=Kocuria tytonis TaxID=2054280 RepID=A0A495A3Z2_9MICC|nr:YciI family protein [Kocuria tytonis]RKQ34191.1 hypothetical protein C1C97_010170 [Kocuria tytonis]
MSIFALNYTYGGPPEILAEHRPAHRAFLRQLNERGVNLASGPLGDDGALILLRADGADEVERLIQDDPLVVHGAVTAHEIREWSVTIGAVGTD